MFGQEINVVGRMTLVAAAAACLSAIGLGGAAIADAVSQPSLVGAWSGPVVGNTGECGNAWGEFAFSPDGTYRYAAIYENCGAIMIDGHYQLQAEGTVLQTSMELCSDPGCPPGPSSLTTSINAPDPDTIVLDGRYTYRRQHG
jgi:hypothetical protein